MEELRNLTNRNTLTTGQLVARTATGACAEVLDEFVSDSMVAPRTDGWRLAEFRGTGFRVWVRLTGTGRFLVAWGAFAARVEFAEVETGVAEFDGRPTLVAEVGESTGFGWARVDALSLV